ncbi:MAG: CotH kinase family protein, partial [Bacteroidales bacterium]|nr:CotH kinase family protein [Bacteroidales bacterium]
DPGNTSGTTYQYKNNYPGGGFMSRSTRTYLYTGPIAINNRSAAPYLLAGINASFTDSPRLPAQNIYKGTVIRAKAIKANALSPHTDTHTYFITPEGDNRYDLPVVSISTNEPDLFDYYTGIYVPGIYADEWVANNSINNWNDGEPANYNQRGDAWERAAHFEYFPKNGDPVYRHDVGIRVHGGWTRAYYRKSLRLYARNSYGTGDTFTYPFFGDLPARGDAKRLVTDFRRLILRNSGNDYDITLYRDALMQELSKDLPVATMAYNPVVHFINGEYWGIINIRERYDQYYLESHYAINADDAAILDAWGNVDQGIPEDRTQFIEIVNYAQNNDPANDTHFQWIMERIDTESLASYYAAQIYFFNSDWPQNNMTFWRNREGVYKPDAPIGQDGRWRWMLYDTDFGMNIWSSNQWQDGLARVVNDATDPSSRIFKRLLRNTAFKNRFINIVTDQLNSCFNATYIQQKVDEYNARLASSRTEHYNRWTSGIDTGNALKAFASQRPADVLTHTGNQFGLSGTALLTVNRTGTGGKVKVNTLTIDPEMAGLPNPQTPFPWSGAYFKNVPVTLTATDEPGYRFSHWLINGTQVSEKQTAITLAANTDVTAVFNATEYHLIHYWHFNNLPEGLLSPLQADHTQMETQVSISYPGTGDGYMDRVNDGTDLNIKNSVEAVRALRVRNPSDTRHLELLIPTTGYEDIHLSYAVTRTGSGAELQNIWYRTSHSGNWVLFQEELLITEVYQLIDLDFSNLREVENNDEFSVKIEFTGTAASGTSGNNRFDNIAVEGYRVSTSQNDPQENAILNIFPVPATRQLNIASSQTMTQIVLYNGNGQVIRHTVAQGLSHQLQLSSLPPGIYILEVATHNNLQRQKITIK